MVLELVDKRRSERRGRKVVWVQIPPVAQAKYCCFPIAIFCYNIGIRRSSQGGHGTGLKNLGCWFNSNLRHTKDVH